MAEATRVQRTMPARLGALALHQGDSRITLRAVASRAVDAATAAMARGRGQDPRSDRGDAGAIWSARRTMLANHVGGALQPRHAGPAQHRRGGTSNPHRVGAGLHKNGRSARRAAAGRVGLTRPGQEIASGGGRHGRAAAGPYR